MYNQTSSKSVSQGSVPEAKQSMVQQSLKDFLDDESGEREQASRHSEVQAEGGEPASGANAAVPSERSKATNRTKQGVSNQDHGEIAGPGEGDVDVRDGKEDEASAAAVSERKARAGSDDDRAMLKKGAVKAESTGKIRDGGAASDHVGSHG